MKAFSRVFTYVWPVQWHRVVLTVTCALLVAILLSVGYVTIIPILKVMIKTDGLHPWVESKVCENDFGIKLDSTHPIILDIDKHGLGHQSGLAKADVILGIPSAEDPNLTQRPSYTEVVRYLASTSEPAVTLTIGRDSNDLTGQAVQSITLITPNDANTLDALNWNWGQRTQWQIKDNLLAKAQNLIAGLPRGNTPENKMQAIILIVKLMLVVTLFRCIAKYFQVFIAEQIVQITVTRMRNDVFNHVLNMPLSYFSDERPSDAMSRIVKDTADMAHALKIMLGKAIREPLNSLVALIFAMYLSWELTLIFLGGAPIIIVIVGQFGHRMKRAARKTLEAGSQMLSKLQESVAGLKVVKGLQPTGQ